MKILKINDVPMCRCADVPMCSTALRERREYFSSLLRVFQIQGLYGRNEKRLREAVEVVVFE